MSARDDVLASIRADLPGGTHDLPQVPTFDDDSGADRLGRFEHWLVRMGGRLGRPGPDGDAFNCVRELFWKSRVVCSTVPELSGTRDVTAETDPRALEDVDVVVMRASLGVAESGSVLLQSAASDVSALVHLAQHLVVLLDPADVVPDMRFAYPRSEVEVSHHAAFRTGPSATADIEGVLIHGAQGVRSLTVILLPKSRQ